MPIDLYGQIKEYIQIRSFTGTKNIKLFVKSDGADLKGVSDLEAALILSNGEKGNVTGIIKNIIIKMIKADIRFDIIMKLTDTGWKTVNDYPQNQRMYGGTAGRKMGITYMGKDYLLKFPGNLKEQQMKNINLSYSNSPVCEYIGSKIYELIGIPVHNTILGIRNNKIVVACEDFLEDGDRLYEFDKIKVTLNHIF